MMYRNLKYFYIVIIAILLIILAFKSCNNKPIEVHNNEPLKTKVKTLTIKKDSSNVAANKSDSTRIKYVIKWRTKLHDTIIYKPCEELILICDSIIIVDSTEISQLKQVINFSDSIITTQKVMLYNDSLDLLAAQKLQRKTKRQRNLALLGLGVVGGVLIVK